MAYPLREHDPERVKEDMLIGTKKRINGVDKYWSGPDLGYQTKATFEKLKEEGYKGNQDYMLLGGWQGHRARLGITEALKTAAPVLEPIATAAGDQYEQFKRGNPLGAWYLESVGQGVGWGLNKLEQGTTALSRVAGVHPFWGNTTIEGIAELATPYIPLTGIMGALKHGDNLGDVASALNKAKRLKLTRTDEVLKWIDEGNEFIRKTGSQKNWKNKIFTDSDGNQWQLKSQGTGKDAKPRSMEAAARDAAGRKARENAWRAQLKEVLERRGTYTPERYKELSKRVTSQINKMKTHIRNVNRGKPREEWISFGHKKSLEGGGINVPENVVFEPYLENVSTQHKFDPSDAAARQSGSPLSVEEWVLQQEILEEFGDILPYRGLPNDLQIKILKTKGQAARDALVEAHLLEKTKIQ